MRNRVSFNVSEKERLRKDEEEQRKKQLAYEQQVNEKRAQLRKDFEIIKQNDDEIDNGYNYDVKESEFKKELDRLISFNESKKQALNKMIMNGRNSLNSSQEIRSTSMETNSNFFRNSRYTVGQENQTQKTQDNHFQSTKYSLQQKHGFESQQDSKEQSNFRSARQSKFGFQQSCYRSQSMQFMSQKDINDVGKLQEHIEEVNVLIGESEQNIFNENEKNEQITKMNKELTHSISQFREKVNHLKRMNEIADSRYKNLSHIEFQANENKRLVNLNVDQAKEKITNIQKVYKQYREKKYSISQQLKQKNEQDEYFLSTIQIKIEDCKKQNQILEKEIAKLDLEKHKQEKREKESYFVGLYLWSFEEIERIFLKGQTDNIIKNYYDMDQQNMDTPKTIKDSNHQSENNNQEKHNITSVNCIFSQATSQVILGASQQVQNQSNATLNQNQSKQNLLDSKHNSPSKIQKNGRLSSQHISPLSSSPLRVSRKLKHKQLKLLDSVTVRYLDDYEVEPPNFDRKEVLEKIHQFYFEHNEDIEPTINSIMMFYKDLLMRCLLLKNQGEDLIQQKKLNTLGLQKLEEEIIVLKENNFFLLSQINVLKESNSQNSNQSRSPDKSTNIEKLPIQKQKTQDRLQIVESFLKENISMDSGFISKPEQGQEKTSTVNVEKFCDLHKQTDNLEDINEKNQKFIFQCYLSIVELMERVCLIVPLIDFKIEQLQQKANVYFDYDYISQNLLKNCSDLFEMATNGKSLEKEFQRICELVIGVNIFQQTGYQFNKGGISSFNNSNNLGQQSFSQLSSQNLQQQSSLQNNPKSTLLQIPNSIQINQFNGLLQQQNSNGQSQNNVIRQNYKQNKKTSQQCTQLLSYLNLDEIFPINSNSNSTYNKVDEDSLQPPQINLLSDTYKQQSSMGGGISQQFQRQSTQEREKEKNIDKICEKVSQDKMARYMLHEQFIKQYIGKVIEQQPEITGYEVLEQIKSEALRLLNDKLNLVFKHFQNVYTQIIGSIYQILRQLQERNIKIRSLFYGSNQPPTAGGILSLPKSDFIIKSYMNAFDKHKKYQRSEDEDWMQKFSRTSFYDRNSLIVNSNNTTINQINSAKEASKKNGIYNFINEISDIRKTMSRKQTAPLSSQSAYFNTINTQGNLNNVNTNNQNNNNNPITPKESTVNPNNNFIMPPSNEISSIISTQQNIKDIQNRQISDNNDKNAIKVAEEIYIDDERKNMKIVERKEYENLKYKDVREKERQIQEEKKKKIVYHRLIEGAETDHTRQEKTAIKQFAIDQDILFKINNIENTVQSDFAEKFNEAIKQESNKTNSKFAKEFTKPQQTYLKTNAIYNLRRDLNLKEREEFLKQDIQHKYFMFTSNENRQNKSQSQRELKQPQISLFINKNNNEPIKLINKKKNHSTSNIMTDIMNAKLQDDNNTNTQQSYSAYPTNRSKSKPLQQVNKLLQKTLKFDQIQSERQNKQLSSYFTPKLQSSNKNSNTSTDDLSRQFNVNVNTNVNQFGSNFQTNSTLLVQNCPSPTMQSQLPIHFKYLNQDWVQSLTNNQQAINSLTSIYLPKNSNVIRKAFTSQTEKRNKSIK